MIACVSPCDSYFEENLSTLTYASRASTIHNTPTRNLDPRVLEIQALKRQVADLQRQLRDAERLNQLHLNSMEAVGVANAPADDIRTAVAKRKPNNQVGSHNKEPLVDRSSSSSNHGTSALTKADELVALASTKGRAMDIESDKGNKVVGVLRDRLLDSVDMVKSLHRTQMRLRAALDERGLQCESMEQTNARLMQENAQLRERENVLLHVALGPSVPLSDTSTDLSDNLQNTVPQVEGEGGRSSGGASGAADIHQQLRSMIRQLQTSRFENEALRDQLKQHELATSWTTRSPASSSIRHLINSAPQDSPAAGRNKQQIARYHTGNKSMREQHFRTRKDPSMIKLSHDSFPEVVHQSHKNQQSSPRVERVWPARSQTSGSRGYARNVSPMRSKQRGSRSSRSFRSRGHSDAPASTSELGSAEFKRQAHTRTGGSARGNTTVPGVPVRPVHSVDSREGGVPEQTIANTVGHLSVSDLKALLGGRNPKAA
jgi:regulator of replication initiation timing